MSKDLVNEIKENPAGDVVEELEGQDLNVAGGASLSKSLGNKGKYCTLTKECMAFCN